MYRILVDGQLFCSSKIEELSVINPVVNLEVNKAGTFVFVVPPTHPYYDSIERRMSLIDVYRDDETEPLFEGICTAVEVDFFKQKTITCEGELTFLNDSTLRPSHKVGLTSRQLLQAYINEHNSLVEAQKRFTVGQVTAKDSNDYITCFTNYQSTMTEIKEDLVDDIGGYLRTRHVNGVRYLDYLAGSPRTSNQVIRLSENLINLVQSMDTEELSTVIIPLGTTLDTQTVEGLDERLTIKSAPADNMHPSGKDYVYSSEAVSNFGWIEKVVTWDDVTTVNALLAKGKKYLQETQWENLVITATAIDLGLTSEELNKFKLLDMIRVVSQPHGLDRYFILSQMTVNLNNPENDTITLGVEEAKKTLSAKTVSENERFKEDMQQQSDVLRSAIDNATALIAGAEGGYVVITRNSDGQPIELKIQDALNNPTKIWRWNINGLGYSSDGGRTYGTAMTMNGSIVADYITSGTMTADRIRGGTLEVGGTGLGANGQITIKDINGNVKGTWNKYGIYAASGIIGGFNISDTNLETMDGTSINDSLHLMQINAYNTNGNPALGVWDRESTSDSWEPRVIIGHNGNTKFRNNSTGNYLELNGCELIGGDEYGEAVIDFGASISDGSKAIKIASDKNLIIDTETAYVGTHLGGTIWRTHTNSALFSLPTAIDVNTGTVTACITGCIFIHGMLLN